MMVNDRGHACQVVMDEAGRFDCPSGMWGRAMDWATDLIRAHDAVDPLRMFCKPPSE
jgi:hypothetical protein